MLAAFRKYGLGYSDFPTMLSNITFFLRTLSLNVDPRHQTPIPILYTVVDVTFVASYVYVYVVSMIWFVFWRCMETGEVLSALIIFSLGTASQIGLYKMIFLLYHRVNLTQLVGLCLDSCAKCKPGSRFDTNLMKRLRIVKRRAIAYWCVTMTNGVLYIMEPLVLPGRHLMEDLFVIVGLEPMFETPNYQIALVLTAMSVFVAVYFVSNATAFEIVIGGYIEAQMLAWSEELIYLWRDAENHYMEHSNISFDDLFNDSINFSRQKHTVVNDYINKRLKDIIDAHAINLNILRKLEEAYTGAIAVEFSLLMVGLIAELLAGLQNTYMEVPFALMQVGMDCFTGQRITDASIVFERAVYHCNWENFDKGNMKLVVTMLMTSQKTMTLSAGGITKLNFVSLLAIIKMIFSAYTTLNTIVN